MRKDLAIALEEGGKRGMDLSITTQVDQFYADVQAAGGSRCDTSSLITRLDLGFGALTLDLSGTTSLEEALFLIKNFAEANEGRPWILGRGWNQEKWGLGRFPTAAELEQSLFRLSFKTTTQDQSELFIYGDVRLCVDAVVFDLALSKEVAKTCKTAVNIVLIGIVSDA